MIPAIMMGGYQALVRPILFRSFGGDPEKIHEAIIRLLPSFASTAAAGLASRILLGPDQSVEIAGIHFPGRVGVAAGLDKDGVAATAWRALGFGFAELGTVTAQPQPGNPLPRLYRLPRSHALINRMGFNNHGAPHLADHLRGLGVVRGENTVGIPLGISIGKTKVVPLEDAVADYLASFDAVRDVADYLALNVSSPNTPGLRTLQTGTHVTELVQAICDRSGEAGPPVFVKIAPDILDRDLDDLISAVVSAGASGLIATNTTVGRVRVQGRDRMSVGQTGGLSGRPLTLRAREVVARAVSSGLPVIASGGIMSVADAATMFDLGARAVQLYSGFIYSGPGLVAGINAWCASQGRW